jgi:Ca2+-binding RTX toxin-like protein
MRRTILTMATTMALMVLVVGGVALAATITCQVGVQCVGTGKNDLITGTDSLASGDTIDARAGDDIVNGKDGSDIIRGRSGDDELHGDGVGSTANDRNDSLRGEGGADKLWGDDGDDNFSGGSGPDIIHADFADTTSTTGFEVSVGGRGNDQIFTDDGREDHIACGAGTDVVDRDSNDIIPTPSECETIN